MSNHRKLDNQFSQANHVGGWGQIPTPPTNPIPSKEKTTNHHIGGGWGAVEPDHSDHPVSSEPHLLGGGWGSATEPSKTQIGAPDVTKLQDGGWPGRSMDEIFMCKQNYTINKMMYHKLCNH